MKKTRLLLSDIISRKWIKVNMSHKNEWIRLPVSLLHSQLTPTAIVVCAVLIDKDQGNHKIQITMEELAKRSGASERACSDAVQLLLERGYIHNIKRNGRGSEYTIANMLPPKRRTKSAASESEEEELSKYKQFINKF